MREKPKKQSYNSPQFLLILFFGPLVCFFFYAIFYNAQVYYLITAALIGILVFLLPFRKRLLLKYSSTNLEAQDINEHKNLTEAEIEKEEISIKAYQDKIINLSQLKGVVERLSFCHLLEDTSQTFCAEVNQLFVDGQMTVILYLFHSKTGELGILSSWKGQKQVNLLSKKGDVFDQWLVKNGQPLLIEDIKNDFRFDVDKIQADEIRPVRSLISVPLSVGKKSLGVLRIDSPKENQFDTQDLRFLSTIGDLGAVAIENAQLYEHVEELAIKDSLTGLYLRRHLLSRLQEEILRNLRRNKEMSFLMIDLDHFKNYNDKFGHMAGDIVLRAVGLFLTKFFAEPGNIVCRYGGEEFAVLLPDCPKKKAIELADELRKIIKEQTIILRREKTHVTVSIGVAGFPRDAQMKEELIHKADQALYKAKQQGRNCVCGI